MVVPCFNEASRWDPAYWAPLLTLDSVTWIFVDDGSTDATRSLISAAISDTPHALIPEPRNRGKAEAVRAGMLHALNRSGQLPTMVGFMDGDGAFDAADVQRILEKAEQVFPTLDFDAVWSSRVALAGRNIDRSARRHYFGRIAATLISWSEPSIPYDTQCGFKVFAPTATFTSILQTPFATRWLFDVEILSRFRTSTGRPMRIWEEPLQYWRDVPGSKVSSREVARIGREILAVKRASRRYEPWT